MGVSPVLFGRKSTGGTPNVTYSTTGFVAGIVLGFVAGVFNTKSSLLWSPWKTMKLRSESTPALSCVSTG